MHSWAWRAVFSALAELSVTSTWKFFFTSAKSGIAYVCNSDWFPEPVRPLPCIHSSLSTLPVGLLCSWSAVRRALSIFYSATEQICRTNRYEYRDCTACRRSTVLPPRLRRRKHYIGIVSGAVEFDRECLLCRLTGVAGRRRRKKEYRPAVDKDASKSVDL